MANMLYRVWFKKAINLLPGEKIFLPVETKEEGKKVLALLKEEKEYYSRIDPEASLSLQFTIEVANREIFVKMIKRAGQATLGYVYSQGLKSPARITLETSEDRLRLIQMLLDGGNCHVKEIEEALQGKLNDDEKLLFGDAIDWSEERGGSQ